MFKVGKCNLPDLLKKEDLTQIQLAELTGIPKSTMNGYVKGDHTMSLVSAYRICKVLDCSIDDLYEWKKVRDAKSR